MILLKDVRTVRGSGWVAGDPSAAADGIDTHSVCMNKLSL